MIYHHQPVLLNEAVAGLAIRPAGIYMDLTFGQGGHSAKILSLLGPSGRLVAVDKDKLAIAVGSKPPFSEDSRFSIHHASFNTLERLVHQLGLSCLDGVLIDLGVSSPQLDDPTRGFSFSREGPLDMRMNTEQSMDAKTWLSQSDFSEMVRVFYEYGEERYAKRIAAAIVKERAVRPIETTLQLSDVILRAVPARERKKHPSTRCFQAIRIVINNELEELRQCLQQCLDLLAMGGRLSVISFHSLEDRIVKRFYQKEASGEFFLHELPICNDEIPRRLKKVGGLIRPTAEEVEKNNRARSARLRIAEKLSK